MCIYSIFFRYIQCLWWPRGGNTKVLFQYASDHCITPKNTTNLPNNIFDHPSPPQNVKGVAYRNIGEPAEQTKLRLCG